MSYNDADLGYDLGYDTETVISSTIQAPTQAYGNPEGIVYHMQITLPETRIVARPGVVSSSEETSETGEAGPVEETAPIAGGSGYVEAPPGAEPSGGGRRTESATDLDAPTVSPEVARLMAHGLSQDEAEMFLRLNPSSTMSELSGLSEEDIRSRLAVGNAKSWLEYYRQQGVTPSVAYADLEARGVIAPGAEAPEAWPYRAITGADVPPVPANMSVEDVARSQAELAAIREDGLGEPETRDSIVRSLTREATQEREFEAIRADMTAAGISEEEQNSILAAETSLGGPLTDENGSLNPSLSMEQLHNYRERLHGRVDTDSERAELGDDLRSEAEDYYQGNMFSALRAIGLTNDQAIQYMNGRGYLGDHPDLGDMSRDLDRFRGATSRADRRSMRDDVRAAIEDGGFTAPAEETPAGVRAHELRTPLTRDQRFARSERVSEEAAAEETREDSQAHDIETATTAHGRSVELAELNNAFSLSQASYGNTMTGLRETISGSMEEMRSITRGIFEATNNMNTVRPMTIAEIMSMVRNQPAPA